MGGACLPDRFLEVAIAVIGREGMILIAQRLAGDSFGGFWEFPGGKPESGEDLKAALAREIREELGVGIEVGAKRMVIEHRYPYRAIRLHCFDCRILEGEPRRIECADWRWISPEEIDRFRFPPASKPLLESIKSGAAAAHHGI